VKRHVKEWLQVGRAQTWPATFLLVMTPLLTGNCSFLQIVIIGALTWLIHVTSFGHNSLLDAAMMYDQRDPSKKHHPLISGAIKLHQAHNIIHWSLALLSIACALLTFFWALNPTVALICLIGWISFGHAYNDGLSKESLLGFLAISLCMTAMGGWGWFLSNHNLNSAGIIYLVYVFFCILYQISYSGFVKEMQVHEKSNILTKMGAHLDVDWKGEKTFVPGKAHIYACLIKGTGIIFGIMLCWLNYSVERLVITVILTVLIITMLYCTTITRKYERGKELFRMSIMEILTIYLPIPLMLGAVDATILMSIGILYFFLINLVLWGKPYPRV